MKSANRTRLRRSGPPPTPAERLRTAFHEAGHFVVWTMLPCRALEIDAITIDDDHLYAGRLVVSTTRPWVTHGEFLEIALVLAGGFQAETLHVGTPNEAAAATDLAQLRAICLDLTDGRSSSARDLEVRVHTYARSILRRRWPAVGLLARKLVEKRRLPGDEARTLVVQVPPALRNR